MGLRHHRELVVCITPPLNCERSTWRRAKARLRCCTSRSR